MQDDRPDSRPPREAVSCDLLLRDNELLRERLRALLVVEDWEIPGGGPQAGMWCRECKRLFSDDALSGHARDCLCAPRS